MYRVRRNGASHTNSHRLIALTFVVVVVATVVLSSAPRRPSRGGVAVATTCASSSRQLTDWLEYHRAIGVTRFYIFEEGTTAGRWSPDVYVFSRKTANENQKNSPSRFAKWLAPYYASGNSTCGANALFVRQTLNLELAIARAKKDGIEWLLHVDVDELVYPAGSSTFDLRDVLARHLVNHGRVVTRNVAPWVVKLSKADVAVSRLIVIIVIVIARCRATTLHDAGRVDQNPFGK